MAEVTVYFSVSPDATITIEKSLSESRLSALGVSSWSTAYVPSGKRGFKSKEGQRCYLVTGSAKLLFPKKKVLELSAGDLVTFPAGIRCTWDVSAEINLHYEQGRICFTNIDS